MPFPVSSFPNTFLHVYIEEPCAFFATDEEFFVCAEGISPPFPSLFLAVKASPPPLLSFVAFDPRKFRPRATASSFTRRGAQGWGGLSGEMTFAYRYFHLFFQSRERGMMMAKWKQTAHHSCAVWLWPTTVQPCSSNNGAFVALLQQSGAGHFLPKSQVTSDDDTAAELSD